MTTDDGTRIIVYVEDEPELLPLLEQVLQRMPVRIEWAPDVESGWKLIEELQPDLIVLDLMLPGEFDGWEICRRVHERLELAKTRIIILSALSDPSHLKKADPYPQVTDYLVKPYQITALRGCLAQALEM